MKEGMEKAVSVMREAVDKVKVIAPFK